ncbi:PASTA domain-containing protein [Leucobacter coleopterorum]|uniref:PASTA domain-containing protein n=1 Tax=Leucobacter coleopterorum TaxID=2714933 RepID=A0ABX6JVM6_9MICO|nr:PASTA domain-containing protein [Leucobacter coleopterorum]QIM18317.1 PASTA domain-containing protein [Leucobacter coleopterorum]
MAEVPDLVGSNLSTARTALIDRSLEVTEAECSSLKVPAGKVAATTPKAGTRLERGSSVEVCKSTGPEMKAVPTIVGLSIKPAKTAIKNAGFTFGKVIEKRFSDEPADSVLAALGDNGEALGDTYPEQARIDLIVSAGSVPDVAGKSVKNATEILSKSELSVNSELNTKAFNSDVAAGSVISLNTNTDPLRTGDSVGLQISVGSVPDVAGMKVKQATDALAKSELSVDPTLGSEAHSDDVPKGQVISLVLNTDPVRPGDAVGLQVSLGPELFEVPDVSGMGLQEAMDALSNAGFAPTTLVPDALRGFATATETNPAAGQKVPAGTEISVKSTLKL